ncbi:MAG: PQQ-binding-like beta-propeller repeat protein, partial [Planctomycetaceae bacterium]|nr:PQQ-binding-like beta-propeller repeat protein [Planctomycetaceae bacterium]
MTIDKSTSEMPQIQWQVGQLAPATASPLVTDRFAYVINGAGVLSCASLESGERLWQCRLSGKFSATPIISGNRLYAVNEEGGAQVVELTEEAGNVVATHEFGETILAAPAAANGAIYFRSDSHLWQVR